MEGEKRMSIQLDFWDDSVAAFEPAKVGRLLRQTFPDASIDPTDYQQIQLERELKYWSREEIIPELRATLIRQSWGSYKTNGPTYRFMVPFPPSHQVRGHARRLSVSFWLPPALPPEHREQLRAFLVSLQMGTPEFDERDGAKPDAVPAPTAPGGGDGAPSLNERRGGRRLGFHQRRPPP